MPHFAYKSRTAGGQLVEGVQEGASPAAVAELLAGRGLVPVDIRETVQQAELKAVGAIELFKPKVGHIDLLLFSRQMHTLLKSGVPILRALAGLQESATNPAMKDVIRDIRENLEGGRELSVALARPPKVL
jgi:MSHA biogenesis protein MshG